MHFRIIPPGSTSGAQKIYTLKQISHHFFQQFLQFFGLQCGKNMKKQKKIHSPPTHEEHDDDNEVLYHIILFVDCCEGNMSSLCHPITQDNLIIIQTSTAGCPNNFNQQK